MIVGNKVVSRREYAKLRNLHEIRLKTMKPVVDMSPPGSFTSRVSNGKKVFNQEERCTEIERENRILYEKIFNINNQSPSFNSKSQAKSLNRDSRKRKIKEIAEENLKLFERIKRKESAYQIQKFNIERKETEKVLSIISEFKQSPEAKKMSSTCFFKRGKKNVISEQLVHRQGKIINGRSYLVEVYRIGKSFKVVAFDLIDDEKFSVNLKKKKGIQSEVDELEFRKLVNRIDICGDGIKLLPDRPVSTLN